MFRFGGNVSSKCLKVTQNVYQTSHPTYNKAPLSAVFLRSKEILSPAEIWVGRCACRSGLRPDYIKRIDVSHIRMKINDVLSQIMTHNEMMGLNKYEEVGICQIKVLKATVFM